MIDRYTLSKMGNIWSEKHKMEIMLKIEVLACEAMSKLGLVPKKALEKIKKKLPDFQSLHEAIEKYESLTDKQAKFVYLLDKILPVINTYLSKDAYYFKSGVSYERWKKHLDTKRLKVDFDEKSFQDLLEQIISFFRSVDKNFFKE